MVKCSKAEVRRLKTALRWKIPAAQRQRIQMVLLRESGMTQPAIAAGMGVSLSTVNRAHMAFDNGGIKEDFEEAAAILNRSPRGAAALMRVCIHKFLPLLKDNGTDRSEYNTAVMR